MVFEIHDSIMKNVKILLDIDDTDMYDKKLSILIPSSIAKLKNGGVDLIDPADLNFLDYCVCISYNVAMDLDLDVKYDVLRSRYVTSVNTLRNRKKT